MTVTTLLLFILFFMKIILHYFEPDFSLIEHPQEKAALILLFFIFITFIASLKSIAGSMISILESLKFITKFSSGIILFILVCSSRELNVNKIINILLFGLIIQSGVSLAQVSFPGYFFPGLNEVDFYNMFGYPSVRATGTMFDYELLSEWYTNGILLSFLLYMKSKKKVYLLCLLSSCIGILCTKTRSGIFLLGVAFIILMVLLLIYKKIDLKTLLLFPALILFTAIILFVLAPRIVTSYITRLERISIDGLNRGSVWGEAASLLNNNIKLFGNGLEDISVKNKEKPGTINQGFSFHSLYLMSLYKMGIAGLGSYFLFWITLLAALFLSLYRYRDSYSAEYAIFFIVIILVTLINGIKIEHTRLSHTIQFVWLLYALAAVVIRQERIKINSQEIINTGLIKQGSTF